VFLVAISGMVQAYAAWAILLYTEQLPTAFDSAWRLFAALFCPVVILLELLLLTVWWAVQAAACCSFHCYRCLRGLHGSSTCIDAARKRKKAVLQSGSQVSATQAATAAAADAVVAEGVAAAIMPIGRMTDNKFMTVNRFRQYVVGIRMKCSKFLERQLETVPADTSNSQASAWSVNDDDNAMVLLCLLSELKVPLHRCFNPFCSRLFKNRFSFGNTLVHFSTILAVLLFMVFVILAGVYEPFYTRGIGMCLGRCSNRPDCWSNITLELPDFDRRPICPGEGRFPYKLTQL
jgi:hypothetical protein